MSIRDSKHQEALRAVLGAFMGPPKQEDPNYVRLQDAGLTLARRVFYPPKVWPTKDVNEFIIKNLSGSRAKRMIWRVNIFDFPEIPSICPVLSLKKYLARMAPLRHTDTKCIFLLLPSLSSV